MITLSFSKLGGHVNFHGFTDESGNVYFSDRIGEFYPGIGISDMERIGKTHLKELERELGPQKDGETFFMDYGK